MEHEKGFTKFSLFKLTTFLFFWFIYPPLFILFSSILHSLFISLKGIKVEFVFDDETIIKPKGIDHTIVFSMILFPFRLLIHMLLGFLLSIIFYIIHLIPSLGMFPDLSNFIHCENLNEFKEYLLNPFDGTNIPIIYFNKRSWVYDENLIKERVKTNSNRRKITLKGIIIKFLLIIFSPFWTLVILIIIFIVWLYRQLIVYSFFYSFIGLYTEGKYINSLSRSSEYCLEKDERKLITFLLVLPRIVFRILTIPIQMILVLGIPPFGILILPITFLTSTVKFINICLKVDYDSIGNHLYKSIKNEFFGWTRNEIVGFRL